VRTGSRYLTVAPPSTGVPYLTGVSYLTGVPYLTCGTRYLTRPGAPYVTGAGAPYVTRAGAPYVAVRGASARTVAALALGAPRHHWPVRVAWW
jgi:hypothetical protein